MLAITGGKGGCGKTTTALGLARELARQGVAPLVVDTDTDMPDLHHFVEVPREPSMDRLSEGTPLSSVARESDRFPGVSLLTAGGRKQVDQGLQRAKQWQGPVIVDCPPGLGPGAVGPLRVADGALVVTTEQPACLEDARQTIRTLRQIDTPVTGVLCISRSGRRSQRTVAGCRVLETAPFSHSPFEDEQVSRVWQRVARKIWASRTQSTPGKEPSMPTPGEHVPRQI